MDPRWFFVGQNNGVTKPWRWRRLLLAGEAVITSEFYEDFGQVVYSAMRSGFSPQQEPWVVVSGNGETLFRAASRPSRLVRARQKNSSFRTRATGKRAPSRPV